MTMILNNDTSHGAAAGFSKWLGHLAGKPNLTGLEVGSYEGASAAWFMRNILTDPTSELICVDTWRGGGSMPVFEDDSILNKFLANTRPWMANVHYIRQQSSMALVKAKVDSVDFAFIDGSHTAPDVLTDSVLVWRLVKPGGVIIWDDFEWVGDPDPRHCPKMGILSFLDCFAEGYRFLGTEYQVAIEKLKA